MLKSILKVRLEARSPFDSCFENLPHASRSHKRGCRCSTQRGLPKELDILLEQKKDLSLAIDELIADIEHGDKYMKVYKQMKMYNDPSLNPVLYVGKNKLIK